MSVPTLHAEGIRRVLWMSRALRLTVPLLASLSALPAQARSVEAQVVQGRVTDASNERVVPNAVLKLLDGEGVPRAAATSDSTGVFRLTAPAPGRYRVAAEQVGYETFTSREFESSPAGDSVTIDIALRVAPVPIQGLEVSSDRVNQRLRSFLGTSVGTLRVRPVRAPAIRDMAMRGMRLSDLVEAQRVPNLQVLPGRTGPCFQHRRQGCLPVFLDGARLTRAPNSSLPLEMLGAVVILLPNELIAYPQGAVLLFTTGFVR